MPFKQQLANRIIERYLRNYDARMRVIQPHWAKNIVSSDPAKRREGIVLLFEAHEACHEGAFTSMRLKPSDWNSELSAVSWAMTLEKSSVSLPEVEFAVLERDVTAIEETVTWVLGEVEAGYTDEEGKKYSWQKNLTDAEQRFQWHYGQLRNAGGVIRRINEISPRAERLADQVGMSEIMARLGTASGRADATDVHLREWLNSHITDQPT
jgi:hypothetical protein